MEILYVIGGQLKKRGHKQTEWHAHGKGIIVQVNLKTGTVEPCLEYVSPSEVCPDKDPSILFKAGTIKEDTLYVCTTTEILVYRLPHFEQTGYISLPIFNDLHHVRPASNDNLLVAVTGLDMVVEITLQGEIVNEWNVLGEDPWERFSKEIDYRKILTTKPHQSHPNFVFQIENNIWASRFEQRDAICLTNPGQRIDIGIERIHDGIIFNDKVYFTTVDGQIVIADIKGKKVNRVVNLNNIAYNGQALGWCRGIHVLDEDLVIVGFSRLRPTKIRENLRWVKRRFGSNKPVGNRPTRIALYDLKAGELCWEHALEDAGLNAVFSIHNYKVSIN